jgi:hypothetical protein
LVIEAVERSFAIANPFSERGHALGGVGECGVHVGAGVCGAVFKARLEAFADGAQIAQQMGDSGVSARRGFVGGGAHIVEAGLYAIVDLAGEFGEIVSHGLGERIVSLAEFRTGALGAPGDGFDDVDAIIEAGAADLLRLVQLRGPLFAQGGEQSEIFAHITEIDAQAGDIVGEGGGGVGGDAFNVPKAGGEIAEGAVEPLNGRVNAPLEPLQAAAHSVGFRAIVGENQIVFAALLGWVGFDMSVEVLGQCAAHDHFGEIIAKAHAEALGLHRRFVAD